MSKHKELEVMFTSAVDRSGVKHMLNKTCPSMFEGPGEPDFTGHIMSVYVGVELKVRPDRLKEGQEKYLSKIRRTGGAGFILMWDVAAGEIRFVDVTATDPSTVSWKAFKTYDQLRVTQVGKSTFLDVRPIIKRLAFVLMEATNAVEAL
jgi:hypothetical protein